ncbi:MAG: arginyltransferase [Magnetococcales bacterium]|nr:arginyltransferase [Magnetococcales bacterium]
MTAPRSPGALAARLNLFLTPPHACGYLPDQRASTLFVDPSDTMHPALYEQLLERGFRRSGKHVYRPFCSACRACVPVRIPVAEFHMQRSLRRVWKRNADLTHRDLAPEWHPDHFDLYRRYLNHRHHGGPMDNPQPETFIEFLVGEWPHTRFHEFRLHGRLVMVAVVDNQPESLSATYTFFDPELEARSLGTYAILWEAAHAQQLGKSALYLGYWIAACRKMRYKGRFRPLEAFDDTRWKHLDPTNIDREGSPKA